MTQKQTLWILLFVVGIVFAVIVCGTARTSRPSAPSTESFERGNNTSDDSQMGLVYEVDRYGYKLVPVPHNPLMPEYPTASATYFYV